jgi:hypothetical protein
MVDSNGRKADFVENEVIVFTNDQNALQGFARKWKGRIVSGIDFSKIHGNSIPRAHLVRVDSSLADPSKLPQDLRAVNKISQGQIRVSSEAGLLTFAGAARENSLGLKTGLNWIFESHSIPNWSTTEAPSDFKDATGDNWSNDAFRWPYMCHTGHDDPRCIQDIGVSAAWRALASSENYRTLLFPFSFSIAVLRAIRIFPGQYPSCLRDPSAGLVLEDVMIIRALFTVLV